MGARPGQDLIPWGLYWTRACLDALAAERALKDRLVRLHSQNQLDVHGTSVREKWARGCNLPVAVTGRDLGPAMDVWIILASSLQWHLNPTSMSSALYEILRVMGKRPLFSLGPRQDRDPMGSLLDHDHERVLFNAFHRSPQNSVLHLGWRQCYIYINSKTKPQIHSARVSAIG